MKKYLSIERVKTIFIPVAGEMYSVRFRDMGQKANCGVFVTNDKNVADALERHPDFNKYFFIESGDVEEEPKPARIFDKEYPDVHRTQEANKVLVSEYGIDKETLKSKEDALFAAEKLNISFPNLQ